MIVNISKEGRKLEKSWFNKSKEEVEQELKTNVENGLSNEEVQAKREKYGFNELKAKKKKKPLN